MSAHTRTTRLAVAAATAGVAVATLAGTGTADAAQLPGAHLSKKVPGGSVSIRLFDESFAVQRPVTNTPLSREVWVSGKVAVQTGGSLKGGTVTTGYLIGCQLDFGAKSGVDLSGEVDFTDTVKDVISGEEEPAEPEFTPSGAVTGQFKLGPGKAEFVPVIRASIGDATVNGFTFTGQRGGVAYSQERFGVDGCAGFAQARALVNVQVSSDEYKGNVTLYGRPFSIG